MLHVPGTRWRTPELHQSRWSLNVNLYATCSSKTVHHSEAMTALDNLGFAIQAADVGTRSILGIQQHVHKVRSERAGRTEEVLRTIEMYENAAENLSSGGAALVAESDQPLRSHIAKIVGTMKELKALFIDTDLEMQACPEAIEAQVIDETKWSRFQSLKYELEVREKGLQFLTMSRILRYRSVRYPQTRSKLMILAFTPDRAVVR